MNKSWLDGLIDDHLSFVRHDGNFNERKELISKICGICGKEFIPRQNQSRLICYSRECIEKYNKAKWELEEEERKRARSKNKTTIETPKIKNQLNGYVYLMQSGNGYFKIGISSDVEKRLYGLKRQFPIKIEIIHYFACSNFRRVEKYLHDKYSSKRIEYEWFDLNKEDVDWIKSINDFQLDDL